MATQSPTAGPPSPARTPPRSPPGSPLPRRATNLEEEHDQESTFHEQTTVASSLDASGESWAVDKRPRSPSEDPVEAPETPSKRRRSDGEKRIYCR